VNGGRLEADEGAELGERRTSAPLQRFEQAQVEWVELFE
jgi:hypothetical protein